MIAPKVDPQDIADIKKIIEDYFIKNPHNQDGTLRQQIVLSPQESEALVNKVLSELGHREYAVMQPEPE